MTPNESLQAAQAAWEAAHERHEAARLNLADAERHLASLEERLASGGGGEIVPDDLTRARAAVDHARLSLRGTEGPLAPLYEAVQVAEADVALDAVASRLRELAGPVASALDGVRAALEPYATAVGAFDSYVQGLGDVGAWMGRSPRFEQSRGRYPRLDGVVLAPCHGDALMAATVLPFFETIKAPSFLRDELKVLAAGVRPLPEEA